MEKESSVDSSQYPHGNCECRNCKPGVCNGRGPAAWEVTRQNRRLRVCTRCIIPIDTERKLLVKESDPLKPYSDFDPIGMMILEMQIMAEEGARS